MKVLTWRAIILCQSCVREMEILCHARDFPEALKNDYNARRFLFKCKYIGSLSRKDFDGSGRRDVEKKAEQRKLLSFSKDFVRSGLYIIYSQFDS